MKKLKAVLFDLDGTLVNSLPLTLKHMKLALEEELAPHLLRTIYTVRHGSSILPDIPIAMILEEFGNGESIIFDRVTLKILNKAQSSQSGPDLAPANDISSPNPSEISSAVLKNYLKRHAATISEVPVYEGIPDMLQRLKQIGLRIGIFTGRSRETTDQILNSRNLAQTFETVITSSDLPHSKPFPDGIFRFRDLTGIPVSEFVFIGDHAYDCDSAIRADCPFIFQNWQNAQSSESESTNAANAPHGTLRAIDPATDEIRHLCELNKDWADRHFLGTSTNATELFNLISKQFKN